MDPGVVEALNSCVGAVAFETVGEKTMKNKSVGMITERTTREIEDPIYLKINYYQ
jgi:hypothetical protein